MNVMWRVSLVSSYFLVGSVMRLPYLLLVGGDVVGHQPPVRGPSQSKQDDRLQVSIIFGKT